MDFEAVKSWLERRAGKEAALCRVKGILGLVLMPVALGAALTLVYWLLRLFTHDKANNLGDSRTCLWITLAVLPCMFLANRLVPRRDLMEERMAAGPESLGGHYANRGVVVRHFFLWILFTGPRLLDWGLDSFREAVLWKAMDAHGCGAALWMLISRGRKVTFEDMQREMEWLNLQAVAAELRRIPGVVYLATPPDGLSLTQDLRDAIKQDLTGGGS